MGLEDWLRVLGSFAIPTLVTGAAALRGYILNKRERVWNAEVARLHGLEKPAFRITVSHTFFRPSTDSIALKPQVTVDFVDGNQASVERFELAVQQTNAELLALNRNLTDIEVGDLFSRRLTEALGLEFRLDAPRLRLNRRTVRDALRSGGLSLLTIDRWEPAAAVRLPRYGGLEQLNAPNES